MKRLPMRDIANIQMGFSFRSGVSHEPSGTIGIIQMKDLGDNYRVALASLARMTIDPPAEQRVRTGDIVLRSRGDRVTSAIVAEDPGSAVVAGPLLRIRATAEDVLPAYLNWFINQPPAQAHLSRHTEGSYVKMLRRQAVDELEIDVPPLERQRAIVELADLLKRGRVLQTDLDDLRTKLLNHIMITYAEGGSTQ